MEVSAMVAEAACAGELFTASQESKTHFWIGKKTKRT
jgi:hypothetical protein